jgi:hypothetical protein
MLSYGKWTSTRGYPCERNEMDSIIIKKRRRKKGSIIIKKRRRKTLAV